MNRTSLRKIGLFPLLFLISFLLMQFVWRVSDQNHREGGFSADKVNLALRRTAHELLVESGDSTSRIPPVEKTGIQTWLVRLDHGFNYERLPKLLQSSLEMHGIRENYDVSVLRCSDGALQLGYNFLDFAQHEAVPCGGRDLEPGCYNVQVTFAGSSQSAAGFPLTGWLLSGVLAIVLYGFSSKWRRTPESLEAAATLQDADWLQFGQSRFDITNQLLLCGSVRHQLTYREAKLLQLFVSRPNQLLERSFILQNVWADEGILVGRSVDMFVSRLRKMLRDDPSVRLAAVHGVGYRLEVD